MYLTRGPNTSTCVLVFITLSTSEALSKGSHHEKKKITGFYENVSQNGDPPRAVFVKSLFRFVTVNFATKSKCDKTG